MSHPREIIRRARRQRERLGMPDAPVQPAPMPVTPAAQAAPSTPTAPIASTTPASAPQPVPRPVGGHALYSELMRSHDRMGTRHIRN